MYLLRSGIYFRYLFRLSLNYSPLLFQTFNSVFVRNFLSVSIQKKMTIEQDVAGVWGNFLSTPEARAIIATAATPSKDVIDKLLLAALAYTRGGAAGSTTGFHQWGDLTFPTPPPTAFIPQSGAAPTNVDLGVMNPVSPSSGVAAMRIRPGIASIPAPKPSSGVRIRPGQV
jgi:hypothetical protein